MGRSEIAREKKLPTSAPAISVFVRYVVGKSL